MSTVPERLMTWAVRVAPESRREWAEAMDAELAYVGGEWARWQWALGCAWIVMRECVAGDGDRVPVMLRPEEESMRKFSFGGAAVAVGLFVVLLLSPMFRQALRIGEDAWTNGHMVSESTLKAMENDARRNKDANLLAWTALRIENPDRVAVAREAVAMDRRLTWIYYPVCSPRPEHDAACVAMIQELKQWAPDNAVPWLMEASYTRSRSAYIPRDQVPTDAGWIAAMDQAFGSPKYDSYCMQRIELERSLYKAGKIDSPMLMTYGLFAHPIPEVRDMQWEAKRLSASAPEKVAEFAGVMQRGSQSDIELIVAMGLTGKGGGNEVAQQAWQTRGMHWEAFATVSAKVFQFAVMGLGVGLLLVLVGIVLKAVQTKKPELVEITAVVGAAMVGVSSVAIYLAYWPYAQVLNTFLQAPGNRVDEGSMAIFGALSQISFLSGTHAGMMVGLWTSVIVVGVVALGWMATRRRIFDF